MWYTWIIKQINAADDLLILATVTKIET